MTRSKIAPLVMSVAVAVMVAIFSLLPEGQLFIGLSSDFWRGALLGILIGLAIVGWPRASAKLE